MGKIALGSSDEPAQPDCIRAAVAELILTFLFVFAGVGSAMAAGALAHTGLSFPFTLSLLTPMSSSSFLGFAVTAKMVGGEGIAGLTAVAVAHTLVVAVMISAGLHISGGHLNPAVTLGLLVGGHISIIRSIIYVVAQLLGSSLACLLLKYLTGGLVSTLHQPDLYA